VRSAAQVAGSYRPLVGDLDGDGDDVFWYGPGAAVRETLWRALAGGFAVVASTRQILGSGAPVALDVDADGAAEMVFYDVDHLDPAWDPVAGGPAAGAACTTTCAEHLPGGATSTGPRATTVVAGRSPSVRRGHGSAAAPGSRDRRWAWTQW
jgi:hypothetical protein